MIIAFRPPCCTLCGHYLTTETQYLGHRCVDPGHWQAAGLLAPRDFYLLARLAAGATAELGRRSRAEARDSLRPSTKS